MNNTSDRYRYVLERPIMEPSGSRWIYNGGATALLLPRLELVVAITAGKYTALNQADPPMVVLRDLILPVLQAA